MARNDESRELPGMLPDGGPDPVFAFFANPTARSIVRALDDGTEDADGRPIGMRTLPERQIRSLEHGTTCLQRGCEIGLLERGTSGSTLLVRLRTHHAVLVLNAAASTSGGEACLNTFGMRATVPVISQLLRNGPQTQAALGLERYFPKATITTAVKALREAGVVDQGDGLLRIMPAELGLHRRIHTTLLLVDQARSYDAALRSRAMIQSLYASSPGAGASPVPDEASVAAFIDIVPADWATRLDARLRHLEALDRGR